MWWRILRGSFRGLVPALLGLLAGWDLPLLRQIRAGVGGVGAFGSTSSSLSLSFSLSLFFSLSLYSPFSLWSLSVSLGTFGVSWGPYDHYWPRPLACLSFGSVGTWWVWWFGSVGLRFPIDRVVSGGLLWPADSSGPIRPFSLLARVSSFYRWSFIPPGSVSLCPY